MLNLMPLNILDRHNHKDNAYFRVYIHRRWHTDLLSPFCVIKQSFLHLEYCPSISDPIHTKDVLEEDSLLGAWSVGPLKCHSVIERP